MAYHNYADVKREVSGNWLHVLEILAPELSSAIDAAPRHVDCPFHGGKKDFRLFKDSAETGGGCCNSPACIGVNASGYDLLMAITGKSFQDVVSDVGDALGLKPKLTREERFIESDRKKASLKEPPQSQPASASSAISTSAVTRGAIRASGSSNTAVAYSESQPVSSPQAEVDAQAQTQAQAFAPHTEPTEANVNLMDRLRQRDPARYEEIQARKKHLEANRADNAERAEKKIEEVWSTSIPLLDHGTDAARAYLKSRDIVIRWTSVLAQDSIRFHPNLEYWAEDENGKLAMMGKYPALICAIRNLDGEIKSLHRTYLTKTGKKHSRYGDARKMMAVPETVTGSSIQLGEPVDGVLGVAEGLETALSAYRGTRIPCWSAISAVLLEKIQIPSSVHTVLIWADRDKSLTGRKVANTLAERLRNEGKTVRIMMPGITIPPGKKGVDWNDVLMKQGILGFPRI